MSESTHVPVTKPVATTTSPMHSTIARGREQKEPISESAAEGIQQVKRVGAELYEKACDACHHWRHYPKLVTSVLLISCFLLGSLTSMGVSRAWFGGGGRHYVSSHWDRETADAHHALDVMLDHLKYPESYQTQHHESLINRARDYIGGIFSGVLPGGRKGYGKGYGEELYDKGREYYDKATGRTYYDKMAGRGVTDKLSDVGHELAYGARRGLESAKDVGAGLGQKIGEMAESVKGTFGGGREYEGGYGSRMGGGGWFGGGGTVERRRAPSGGISSWFSSSEEEYKPRGYSEEDNVQLAREKMKNIVRTAEREL